MKKLLVTVMLLLSGIVVVAQYQQKSNDSYQTKLDKAYKTKKTGASLMSVGILSGVVGAGLILYNNRISQNYSYGVSSIGAVLFFGGGILTNIGIPLYIAGSVNVKTNKKNMMKELRVSTHGLGLKLTLKL